MPAVIMCIVHLLDNKNIFDICIPSYNAPTKMVGAYQYIQIGVNSMKFNTKLEKSRYNSAIDRINSNIDYALKKGLEFTDYHQDFQNKMVRYGVVLTPTGKISKKSNLTPAQLKELERTSKVASRFQKKYGSTENAKKVINVQKFHHNHIWLDHLLTFYRTFEQGQILLPFRHF